MSFMACAGNLYFVRFYQGLWFLVLKITALGLKFEGMRSKNV